MRFYQRGDYDFSPVLKWFGDEGIEDLARRLNQDYYRGADYYHYRVVIVDLERERFAVVGGDEIEKYGMYFILHAICDGYNSHYHGTYPMTPKYLDIYQPFIDLIMESKVFDDDRIGVFVYYMNMPQELEKYFGEEKYDKYKEILATDHFYW